MIDTINGAHSSAIIYSIAETAKANNLKPYDYFVYLLEEIPKHMEQKIEPFLRTCYHGLKNFQKGFENNSSQEPPITAVLNFSMYSLLSVYYFSVFSWRISFQLVEKPAEIKLVIISDNLRNLIDGISCCFK